MQVSTNGAVLDYEDRLRALGWFLDHESFSGSA